jgi:hypothetical protein
MTLSLLAGNAQNVCLITTHRTVSIPIKSDAEYRGTTHETGYLRDESRSYRPAEVMPHVAVFRDVTPCNSGR